MNGLLTISCTHHFPSHIGSNSSGVNWDGKDPDLKVLVSMARVAFDHVETMKIEMVGGNTVFQRIHDRYNECFFNQ